MADRASNIELTNDSGIVINPATEEKQEEIISALGTVSLDLLLDDTTTANITYIGEAVVGTPTSSASWRIKRLNETSGLYVGWADSSDDFIKIWDNRTSFTYSK